MENTLMFAEALRKNHVPFDLHIYQKGGHGMGLGNHTTRTHRCIRGRAHCLVLAQATWLRQLEAGRVQEPGCRFNFRPETGHFLAQNEANFLARLPSTNCLGFPKSAWHGLL